MKALIHKAEWKNFIKHGLALVLATLALPVMAQVEELSDAEKHGAVPHGMSAAARHARSVRAKALAAPLVQNGMDAVSAFEFAWAALAAEEEGKGRAEDILADLQKRTPGAVAEALSADEFVALLAALEEEHPEATKSRGAGLHALLHRLGLMLQNDRENHGLGYVDGTASCAVSGRWVQMAQHQEQRDGAILPSVWHLVNQSGTLLHQDPEHISFLPPGRPGGSDHDTVIDEEDEEKKRVRKEVDQEETQTLTLSLDKQNDTQPAARSLGVSLMSSFGGGGGGLGSAAPRRMMMMAAPAPLADTGSDAPGGDVVWKGDPSILKDGVSATFDKSSTVLDVKPNDVWRPYEVVVDDSGVAMTQRGEAYGKIGYAFCDTGSIGDYEGHKTTLTKKGEGILVMAKAGNSYSGGTDVQGGTIYVADQGALGTGAVTMHDGTAMWVNYTWNLDYTSSFRNPVVSNSIRLADGASATVSYGDFIYRKVLGNNTSRVWRNLYLTGGLSGGEDTRLLLQGYTSRLSGNKAPSLEYTRRHLAGNYTMRNQVWYSGFILNRSVAAEDEKRFYGTLTLGNHVNDSLHRAASGDAVDDRLSDRESGAVKLVLSDDVLEYGTLDATREFAWSNLDSGLSDNNKLLLTGVYSGGKVDVNVSDAVSKAYTDAGGTSSNYGSYGLRQTHSNVILISNNTKVGELKADLLGVTQESYRDVVDWSEALEVKLVRAVTLENSATLTLGKDGSKADSWFSGMVGFAKQLCDADGDGYDYLLKKEDVEDPVGGSGSTVAGVSMVKVGDNAQYIHSAKLHNLVVDGGTLGFNNVDLAGNLQLRSGTKLRLGVQDDHWTNTPDTSLDIGVWGGNNNHRLTILTNDADSMESPITGEIKPVPTAARIEGQLMLHAGTELEFMVENLGQDAGDRKVIIPVSINGETVLSSSKKGIEGLNYLKEHSLLQVTGPAGIEDPEKKDGVLTLSQDVAVSLTGVNFLRENYSGRTYFLAAADKIIVDGESVAEGHASDFASRIVTLGYGFYGIVSTIDGHGYYNNGAYQTYTGDSYLGQDFLTLKVAADPTRSWTGSTVARGVQGGVDKEGNAIAPWLGTANTWKALPGIADYTEYFASDYAELNDAQWKENQVYTDGVSAKFGNLYMPDAWAEFLKSNTNATLDDFKSHLLSESVTKVDDSKQIFSPNGHGNGIAMRDETGRVLYGVDGSAYFNEDGTKFVTPDGLSAHYEEVRIKGTVRPGYVTVNSDYTLETKTADGKTVYETMTDDTNYVFTSATYTDADGNVIKGCIADATAADMEGIYSGLLLGADLDAGVRSDLANWHTGLAKGGTGTLVMDTENTYSGGSLLRGGLTVMRNRWSLGMEDPKNKTFDDADAKGGRIEMAYGAGLMVDYIYSAFNTANTIAQGQLTNDLVITHMADFDNTKATGDAQLMNRYDVALVVDTLTSYDDAILTLRGASLAENSFIKKDSKGEEHAFYSYADYVITNPVNAYGTIRMAGYLQGGAGRVLTDDGSAYKYGGGNVQLTISGHDAAEKNPKVLWDNTTIDLSLNGGNKNVLAIETRFLHNADGTVTENDGKSTIKLTLGTLKDDGKSGYNACVINDASSERIGSKAKTSYLAILTLDPAADATFSGNVGFGIGQNAEGADMPSRGYISLIKTGAATQTIGNARLLDLTVQDSGLMHFNKALSAASISTTNVGTQHIHVGAVEDAAMSHTLTVGKGGVLSFDTTLNADPLANIKGTESDSKYGAELSYVLLKDGATVTGSGNWYTNKGIAVMVGAEITFNTHDYSMDHTVTSDMAVYGASAQTLKDAFDDSHIFWMKQALAGDKVTLNLVNEQMSVGATEEERGKATSNGYIITRDLNAYKASSYDVWYGLQGGSTVNIGAKTILQSYMSATKNSGIEYNIAGTDAALQFLDADADKLKLSTSTYGGTLGETSYVAKATLAEGGRIILGGAAAANNKTLVNTNAADEDITADADVVITNKAGQTASVQNMKVNTVNDANGYETILSAVDGKRATVKNAEMTVKKESSANNTLVQKTDINTSLVHLQQSCSVTMEDVLVAADSKVEGEGPASGNAGAEAIAAGATAAPTSVTLTNEATRINTTLTHVQNVVKNAVLIQVAKADQLSRTDVGGQGLTLGLSQETLEKATAAGVRYLAIQVSDSGRFLYEQQAVLASIKLTDHNGATYVNPAYEYKVVSSVDVAKFLGVDQSEVSDTLIYIEVSETPEPATAALSLLALAGLMARRKRK